MSDSSAGMRQRKRKSTKGRKLAKEVQSAPAAAAPAAESEAGAMYHVAAPAPAPGSPTEADGAEGAGAGAELKDDMGLGSGSDGVGEADSTAGAGRRPTHKGHGDRRRKPVPSPFDKRFRPFAAVTDIVCSQDMAEAFKSMVTIDVRGLAVFRVCLACQVLFDLMQTSPFILLSDYGVLPRKAFLELSSNKWYFSLHAATGSWEHLAILMAVEAAFCVMLLVGYRTKLANLVVWVLVVSRQNRNPMMHQGGDVYVRMLLFWALFLPLNEAASVDRYLANKLRLPLSTLYDASYFDSASEDEDDSSGLTRRPRRRAPNVVEDGVDERDYSDADGVLLANKSGLWPAKGVCSWGSVALHTQVMLVYFISALWKNDPIWNVKFNALYYALELGSITTPLGEFLLGYPDVLRVGTALAYGMELAAPILVYMPQLLFSGVPRFVGIATLAMFHIGSGTLMYIGIFPWAGCVGLIPMYPPQMWDAVSDAVAGLWARVRGAASLPACLNPPQDSEADGYPVNSYSKWWHSKIIIFALSLIMCWLTFSLEPNTKKLFPAVLQPANEFIKPFVLTPRFDQSWKMFSPHPPTDDGWWVFPAELRDGRKVDLFKPNGGPIDRARTMPFVLPKGERVSQEKPEHIVSWYLYNDRWRKYLSNLNNKKHKDHRLWYGRFICRSWNSDLKQANHTDHLMTFKLLYVETVTHDKGQYSPRRVELWSHTCW